MAARAVQLGSYASVTYQAAADTFFRPNSLSKLRSGSGFGVPGLCALVPR
jgi:hypothetical protein